MSILNNTKAITFRDAEGNTVTVPEDIDNADYRKFLKESNAISTKKSKTKKIVTSKEAVEIAKALAFEDINRVAENLSVAHNFGSLAATILCSNFNNSRKNKAAAILAYHKDCVKYIDSIDHKIVASYTIASDKDFPAFDSSSI